MKLRLLLLAALFAALPAPAVVIRTRSGGDAKGEAVAPGDEPMLHWRNGESLPGELISATGDAVTWKSPAFSDPLVVGWSALRLLEQHLPSTPSPEPFAFTLRDGSLLLGQLTSISPEVIGFRSARHGEISLRRSEVLSVRRRQSDRLLFAGPAGDAGWRPFTVGGNGQNSEEQTGAKVPPLREGPGGVLSLPFWNRAALLGLKLPEKVEVEFRVSARERPDFALYLEGNGPAGPRVETWDGELVLTGGAEFQRLRTLGEKERSVALRLCCNRKAHVCSAWTPEGEKLAEWSYTSDPLGNTAGLVLQSKGRDLTLDFLLVRPWDGLPPARLDAHSPRLVLADGRVVQGEVTAGSPDWLTMRPAGEAGETSFAFADVETLVFSTEAAATAPAPATLLYADGTLLRGRLESLQEGQAHVRTPFAEGPVAAALQGLRQLKVESAPAASVPALAELDVLEMPDLILHGRLSGGDDGSARWLPVGGLATVRPALQAGGVINRALSGGAGAMPGSSSLFYTTSGDVLPGRLRALDSSGVEIESSLVSIKKLPGEMLQAIQFGSVVQAGVQGFHDPGWRVVKGDPKAVQCGADGVLHLPADASYGHPSAMQGTEVKLSFGSGNFETVRLRMFCAGTDPAKSVNLVVQRYSDRTTLGIESTEGQLDNQYQVRTTTNPVPLRLLITENQVEVQIDGSTVRRFPVEPSKRAGAGLIIEPSGLWGNRVSPAVLSAFSAPTSPGRTWLPEISAQAKAEALTVPRFRKERPPRQALIAANGDVLRGEILAATATHFEFRSGLENLRVPQDRVRAAIWLQKPGPNAALAAVSSADPVRKRLQQPIERNIGLSNAGIGTVLSILQQEAGDLKFRLPEAADRRRFRIQIGSETLGEALDKLCEITGYHYHVDEGGTIVFEAAVKGSAQYASRIYWLRPGAFPAEGSVKQLLAEKGILFPAGSAIEWRPSVHELAMANTPEAHDKLTAVLKADFGGSLGSPTHWLLLANGARLALMVEKFGPEIVVGQHPVYGRCEIPLREIYRIHTSEPPSTAVMASLSGWHLVDAPEPVLPESGGETSPLLGQPAKPIRLALLGGGEFDLAKEKGKVVVLDFWATWCGPCIKSLPGLIEAMKPFPAEKVAFVGLNQGEAPAQVQQFLEAREWQFPVALDVSQSVAGQYGVDGIPYTVVIAPDGKVAYIKTGYSPDGDAEIAGVVRKLLTPPAPAAPTGASPAPSADWRSAPPAPRG